MSVGDESTGPGAPGETPWRRLDRRMLLVHPVTELVRFLPALIGVFVVGGTGDDGTPAWWQVGSVVLPVLLGLLRWVTTRFRVTASRVELRRGCWAGPSSALAWTGSARWS